MSAGHITMRRSPLHTARVIASFALLGAVVAGCFEVLPAVAAFGAAFELQAFGAFIGGIAGAVTQHIQA